jgi:hypothetical protein
MKNEILNIEHNVKQLVLKALNKFNNMYDAAAALRINTRTLWRYRNRFDIVKDPRTNKYFFKETEK